MISDTPDVVDALPYIDTAIDDDENQRLLAMRLVDDEIELYPPDRDYLEALPDIRTRPFITDILQNEYDFLEENIISQRPNKANLSQIHVDIPKEKPGDSSTIDQDQLRLWQDSLNQVKIKLEYRQKQMTNLELLKTFGGCAWKNFIRESENMEAGMNQELDRINEQIQVINKERKNNQEFILRHLNALKSEWENCSIKNQMLAEEIEKLQASSR